MSGVDGHSSDSTLMIYGNWFVILQVVINVTRGIYYFQEWLWFHTLIRNN